MREKNKEKIKNKIERRWLSPLCVPARSPTSLWCPCPLTHRLLRSFRSPLTVQSPSSFRFLPLSCFSSCSFTFFNWTVWGQWGERERDTDTETDWQMDGRTDRRTYRERIIVTTCHRHCIALSVPTWWWHCHFPTHASIVWLSCQVASCSHLVRIWRCSTNFWFTAVIRQANLCLNFEVCHNMCVRRVHCLHIFALVIVLVFSLLLR